MGAPCMMVCFPPSAPTICTAPFAVADREVPRNGVDDQVPHVIGVIAKKKLGLPQRFL